MFAIKERSHLFSLVSACLIILVYIIYTCLRSRPVFTTCILSIMGVALGYVLTENMWTHDSAELENRFWTIIAFWLAYTVIFVSDSPLNWFDEDKALLKWVACGTLTYVAHNFDRHLRRTLLVRTNNMKRIKSSAFAPEHKENAKRKIIELNQLIEDIDSSWISSMIQGLFIPQVLLTELQIIELFEDANKEELNIIVSQSELARIFEKVKDRYWSGNLNRSRLLKLVCVDRINELNVPAKAMILDALQRIKLSAHKETEKFVLNIIQSTKSDDLSMLKCLTDSKGDINSLHKLIYIDIRDKDIQKKILEIINNQAQVQLAHKKIRPTGGARKGAHLLAWRKILSDVDDTLECSFHDYPAGIDYSYPKHVVYPGVLAFYRELDIGTVGPEEWDESRVGNLVFLSARPQQIAGKAHEKFKKLQNTRGLYTTPSLLAGDLTTGTQFIGGKIEPMAVKKFENFNEYMTLYPEFEFIFIGDNGQGDVRAAEMVLDGKMSENIQRIYIHEVQSLTKTHTGKAITKTRSAPMVFYFKSYVDAALDAAKNGLIRPSGLRRLAIEANHDFVNISFKVWDDAHQKSSSCTREEQVQEHNAALRRANAFLAHRNPPLEEVPLLLYRQGLPCGTAVSSIHGPGIVQSFNAKEGLYTVLLNMGHKEHCGLDLPRFSVGYLRGPRLKPLNPPGGGVGRSTDIPSIVPAKSVTGRKNSQIGGVAWTPFGLAEILSKRKADGVVALRACENWKAIFYMPARNIVQITLPPEPSASASTALGISVAVGGGNASAAVSPITTPRPKQKKEESPVVEPAVVDSSIMGAVATALVGSTGTLAGSPGSSPDHP